MHCGSTLLGTCTVNTCSRGHKHHLGLTPNAKGLDRGPAGLSPLGIYAAPRLPLVVIFFSIRPHRHLKMPAMGKATGTLLICFTFISLARSISYIHDELLYTKHIWDEFKLPFPYSVFEDDDPSIAKARETVAGLFIADSLNGPQPDLEHLIEQDKRRGKFQPNSFDVTPIEDTTPLSDASIVAQCKTCIAFVSVTWEALVDWTHKYARQVTPRELVGLGEELCEYEVPNKVLKDWVVLSARVHRSSTSGTGTGPGSSNFQQHTTMHRQQFYMLSLRHRQHARPREIQVVRAACRSMLTKQHEDAVKSGNDAHLVGLVDLGAEPSPLLLALAQRQAEYLEALEARGGKAAIAVEDVPKQEMKPREGMSAGGALLAAMQTTPAPRAQRGCYNRHPQCGYWAEKGECKVNPMYMMGTSPLNGHCREACKSCVVPPPTPPAVVGVDSLKGEDVALQEKAKALVDSLLSSECVHAAACRWVEGNDAKDVLAAAVGVDVSSTAALRKVAIVAGPVDPASTTNALLHKHQHPNRQQNPGELGFLNGISPLVLQASLVVSKAELGTGIVPKEQSSSALKRQQLEALSASTSKSSIERALWNDLGGQCVYAASGWWSYEVCFGISATQFHIDTGAHVPDWIISLGKFAKASYTPVQNATDAALYPQGAIVPYVTHALEGGSECELTGEGGASSLEGVGGQGQRGLEEEEGEGARQQASLTSSLLGRGNTNNNKNKQKTGTEKVKRTSLIRFMCSPSPSSMHMVVSEPEQCRYLIDLYLPTLCQADGMAVDISEDVKERVAAMEKKVKEQIDRARKLQQQQVQRGGGGGGVGGADLEDDPYLDPDDDVDVDEGGDSFHGVMVHHVMQAVERMEPPLEARGRGGDADDDNDDVDVLLRDEL